VAARVLARWNSDWKWSFQDGRAAMSATKSKTSSRGAEM
jgi:hypothetical protein